MIVESPIPQPEGGGPSEGHVLGVVPISFLYSCFSAVPELSLT